MSLKLNCDICGDKIDEPGALIFSPPKNNSMPMEVDKIHVCINCWQNKINKIINETSKK